MFSSSSSSSEQRLHSTPVHIASPMTPGDCLLLLVLGPLIIYLYLYLFFSFLRWVEVENVPELPGPWSLIKSLWRREDPDQEQRSQRSTRPLDKKARKGSKKHK